jgi:purine-cytosine permease-like protein
MKDFIHFHFHRLKKTEKVWVRRAAGILLCIGGMLGFLPVLGYWMFPLGLALLAVDWPFARRLYRQLVLWWGRNYQRFWPPARRIRKASLAARARRNSGSPGTHNDPSPP